MAYRVRLEGSEEGQKFDFRNYDDALNFASLAIEYGTYQGYRWTHDEKGESHQGMG